MNLCERLFGCELGCVLLIIVQAFPSAMGFFADRMPSVLKFLDVFFDFLSRLQLFGSLR